uniref:Hamartin n=1 Tax=Plectus sambesii TaxID=2011161 RepID=A0A914XJD5_9BILA
MPIAESKADTLHLIRLLESGDAKVSEEATQALRQQLAAGDGIDALLEHYSMNKSGRSLELLCTIREPSDRALLDKLQDALQRAPLATFILLGQIVQNQPSWLPKLSHHMLFHNVLRQIHTTQSTILLIAGLLLLSSLLPHCPLLNEATLENMFITLYKAGETLQRRTKHSSKTDSETEVHTAHLRYAIKQYFTRLYGIYPWNLLHFLRSKFVRAEKSTMTMFSDVFEPLLNGVRLHPMLLVVNKEKELSKERWARREPHDVLADCERVIVDEDILLNQEHDNEMRGRVYSFLSTNSTASDRISKPRPKLASFSFRSEVSSEDLIKASALRQSRPSFDDPADEHYSSPSVAVGLETPPESERATPVHNVLARRDSLTLKSGQMLVPTVDLRRSTGGAEDLRNRRPSFGQRMTNLLRPRGKTESNINGGGSSPTLLKSSTASSFDTTIPATTAEEEEADASEAPVEVVGTEAVHHTRQLSINSTAEEATEARESPPTLTEVMEQVHQGTDETADAEVAQLLNQSPAVNKPEIQFQVVAPDSPPPLSTKDGQRFSVASYMTNMNRMRFHSECPPLGDENDNDEDDFTTPSPAELTQRSMDRKRSLSCPMKMKEARERVLAKLKTQKIEPIAEQQPFSNEGQAKPLEDSGQGSAPSLKDIADSFPYLQLLKSTRPDDETDGDAIALAADSHRRDGYMDASEKHHNSLAALGLADRGPGKIYDDMSHILQGVPLPQQVEVLRTRLALVNQHLLYERSRRLIHAQRNRRLFGRLKQQKTNDEQWLKLNSDVHQEREQKETFVKELIVARKVNREQQKQFADAEYRLNEQLTAANGKIAKLERTIEAMKRQHEQSAVAAKALTKEVDLAKRRAEDAETMRLLAERQTGDVGLLRAQLDDARRTNSALRDKFQDAQSLTRLLQNAESQRRTAELRLKEVVDSTKKEVSDLKRQLRKERNHAEASAQLAQNVEPQLRESRQHIVELNNANERAGQVHQEHVDAAEQKFRALMSVCRRQEAHIVDLYKTLEEQHFIAPPGAE